MENGWSVLGNSVDGGGRGGQNGTFNMIRNPAAWDFWDSGTSRPVWSCTSTNIETFPVDDNHPVTVDSRAGGSAGHALMNMDNHSSTLYGGPHWYPDPHLTCLNLGKRHYFEDATALAADRHVAGLSVAKRGKGGGYGVAGVGNYSASASASASGVVARCQVEGCHVALVNAKDYHRRHKVCELHSKAPKVIVLGEEQRFCQQCSRFHAVAEFDDTKRSCRRRLAGHNERRRKGSHDFIPKNHPSQGRALSLLSSSKRDSWFSSSVDLSSRCSAALCELIAQNRVAAAILSQQLTLNRDLYRHNYYSREALNNGPTTHEEAESNNNCSSLKYSHHQHQVFPEADQPGSTWDQLNEAGGAYLTLDLMQAPNSAFGFFVS